MIWKMPCKNLYLSHTKKSELCGFTILYKTINAIIPIIDTEKRTIPQKNVIKLITWSFFVDYHSDLIMVSRRKWGRNLEIDILHINIPKNVSNPLFVGRYSSLKNPRCHLPTACVEYPVSRNLSANVGSPRGNPLGFSGQNILCCIPVCI